MVKDRLQHELTPGKDSQAAAAGSGFLDKFEKWQGVTN